jgi:hypothetical protein
LLIELARRRPDLRVAIAGRGRAEGEVERATAELSNLTFLGWRPKMDELFARTRSIYYGLDPSHPYSEVACPNTLYEALWHRKPLIFFCAGEVAELASQFHIGIRCEPNVDALSKAVDLATDEDGWEFDQAWRAVCERSPTDEFVGAVLVAARA